MDKISKQKMISNNDSITLPKLKNVEFLVRDKSLNLEKIVKVSFLFF